MNIASDICRTVSVPNTYVLGAPKEDHENKSRKDMRRNNC